jgi:lipopolysaccharide transport system permease protein
MLWQVFAESLNGPLTVVTSTAPLLSRINFPRESIILAKLGEVLFNLAIRLILVVAVFIWFQIPVSWITLLAPLALAQLILLGTTLGLFLTPACTLYQDLGRALTVFLGVWVFLTPVVYQVPRGGVFGAIVNFNPVTPLLVTTRELASGGTVSDPFGFFLVSALTLAALLPAWAAYRLAMPFVVERWSS